MRGRPAGVAAVALWALLALVGACAKTPAERGGGEGGAVWVWWEAERPSATNFPPPSRNPFKPLSPEEAEVLSEGQWIGISGNYGGRTPFLEYEVRVPETATYHFYVRKFWKHGPFRWRFDTGEWHHVGPDVSLLDHEELRKFVCANWIYAGTVKLAKGRHTLRIELTQPSGAAAFDCLLLTTRLWIPKGKLKPGEKAEAGEPGWFPFDPEADPFSECPIDLRRLNERFAGEKGFVEVRGDRFVHGRTGEPIRFWGVNAGPDIVRLPKPFVDYLARYLAKLGVNIVRVHGKVWRDDDIRRVDRQYLDKLFYLVAAMKRQGIYTALSIYFPLWLNLDERKHGFAGYHNQHPFALLFFNRNFQEIYKGWWREILTTPNPYTGLPLKDDPAVAIAEIINEDSYLFWTFSYGRVPVEQMEILERQFGRWLARKYGSLEAAFRAWGERRHKRDDPAAGRAGFVSLWEVFNRRDGRCQDTAQFLTLHQRRFFEEMYRFLKREIGFKGCVYGSNWKTASPKYLGPLDKWSNLACDFVDRHGYFGGPHKGEGASYSIRKGHLYGNRCALLDVERGLPLMDICYNGRPSTITEVNWTPPNRFRADFPLLMAAYGSLQGTDGIFFFALRGPYWQRTMSKFAIETPTVMGQFPAAALIYRLGLVREARPVVVARLKLSDLFALKGAPVVEPMNLDLLRTKEIPPEGRAKVGSLGAIDPLSFLVGKVEMWITEEGGESEVANLSRFVDRGAKVVRSETGELLWDFGRGLVVVNSPHAQGATGFLRRAGRLRLRDAEIEADIEYGTILLVPLDGKPIRESARLLLQVATEERNFGWRARPAEGGLLLVEDLGRAPLVVREPAGKVRLLRPDVGSLEVVALDHRGYPARKAGTEGEIRLLPDVLYYLIEAP